MSTFIAICWMLGVVGAIGASGCVVLWMSVRAIRARVEELEDGLFIEPPAPALVIVRGEPPMDDAQLRGVMQGWKEDDERWRALVQLLDFYAHEAIAQAACPAENANPTAIAHANGAWLALQGFHAALRQLRAEPEKPRGTRRAGSRE